MQQIPASARDERVILVSNSSVTGDLRLHEFDSRIFRNQRFLRVWLPPEYEASQNRGRHYPVLYLNDGQNLFETATAFGGTEWQADETADRLIRAGAIPPLIIVGIDNAQNDRIKEYFPYRTLRPPVLRPRGERYPDFLMNEVMPFVQQRYRIARGPQHTGLGGSSLGALIALYTVIQRRDVFGRLLIESPSLFVANRRILKQARSFIDWPERIFLAIGTKEVGRDDKDRQAVDDVRALELTLRRAGLNDQRLLVKIDEGAIHNEREWAKRFPEALSFLFAEKLVETSQK